MPLAREGKRTAGLNKTWSQEKLSKSKLSNSQQVYISQSRRS